MMMMMTKVVMMMLMMTKVMMMMMIKMKLLMMVNLAKLGLHGHHAFLCLCSIYWTFGLNNINHFLSGRVLISFFTY